ncbi:MAG: STAS domain-containing protein, partial [Bryobacterales bacterium]|nr:STAS domain-containing protein [Bryobacterales bacterium]
FEGAIQQKLDAGCVRIAVDCAGLSYISSAGLGVFMSFIEELREKDGDIRIGGLLPKVRQVFDILGFTEIFRIFDTARDAVSSFDSQEASHAANV